MHQGTYALLAGAIMAEAGASCWLHKFSELQTVKAQPRDQEGSHIGGCSEATHQKEIALWMTPMEAPKALQTSRCSELLSHTRANLLIFAHH